MLRLLSLIKWFFIQISIIHDNILLQICKDKESIKLCFSNWHGSHALCHQLQATIQCFKNHTPTHPPLKIATFTRTDSTKLSWDGSTCKLIHEKCLKKRYHNDTAYHMTLNTTFSVVFVISSRSSSDFMFEIPINFFFSKPTTLSTKM